MPPTRPTNTAMAAKRLRREIADLANENLGAISLVPNEANIFQWRATLPGPAGSPYEGGVFDVEIVVPQDYPFSPPNLLFRTKVYHCNIAHSGAICLDLLKTAWSPALSLYKVILSLSSLLTDPNPSDPLVPSIAQEYKRDRKQHDATAREWVKLYATPKTEVIDAQPAASTSSSRSSSARPRAIRRQVNGSTAPPPSVLGTRRAAQSDWQGNTPGEAISILDDDDDDVEVLGESSSATANGGGAEPGRRSKRARVVGSTPGAGAGGGADDVIVIDD